MSRATVLIVLAVLRLGALLCTESEVVGQDLQKQPMLLIVHRQCDLLDTAQPNASRSKLDSQVRSGTAIVGIRREDIGEPTRGGWHVVTLEEPPRNGWLPVGAVMPFDTRGKELKATAIALRAAHRKAPTLPELILIQDNPAIQQAWREVSEAVAENETLPENERYPDPYFARAEIWASVNNYSDSLQDYLTGIAYARKANRDLLSYSAYFDKLLDVAEKLQELPVPAKGAHPDLSVLARQHYSQGYGHLFTGKLQEALDRFDNAVQLAPDQPLYWYFRALTQRRLGDDQRAQHDALMGAYFERQFAGWRQRSLDHAFIRVQGEWRMWLESFRLGWPSHRLLLTKVAGNR